MPDSGGSPSSPQPHDHWCTLTTDSGEEFVVVCNADMCEDPGCEQIPEAEFRRLAEKGNKFAQNAISRNEVE